MSWDHGRQDEPSELTQSTSSFLLVFFGRVRERMIRTLTYVHTGSITDPTTIFLCSWSFGTSGNWLWHQIPVTPVFISRAHYKPLLDTSELIVLFRHNGLDLKLIAMSLKSRGLNYIWFQCFGGKDLIASVAEVWY